MRATTVFTVIAGALLAIYNCFSDRPGAMVLPPMAVVISAACLFESTRPLRHSIRKHLEARA